MIKRSRRRNPAPATTPLTLHLAMAQRQRWQRRLSRASACACAGSVVLWLLGVPLAFHLGGLVAAFGVGLALPVRLGADGALKWIGERGLSYPTALELAQSGDDPYGFHAAVAQRAGVQAARLEPPKPQPWWLPLLVTALVLAALPVSPQTRRGLFTSRPTGQSGGAPQAETPPAAEPAAEPIAGQQPEEPAAGEQPGTRNPAGTGGDPDDLASAAEGEGGSSDAEAMDRFLEGLRERPPSREPSATNPFRGAAPAPSSTDASSRGEPGGAAPPPPTAGAPPPQGERGDGERGQGEGEQDQGEAGQGEPGQGEQGDQGDAQGQQGQSGAEQGQEQGQQGQEGEAGQGEQAGEQGQGEQEQGQQGQGEQDQNGQQAGGAGEQPQEEGAQDENAQGQGQEGAPGDAGGNPNSGESGEGAGDAGGNAAGREDGRLSGPSGDPEQLRGRLNSGPSNVAGTVRLPNTGQTPQTLGGDAPVGFSRAEERAVTEGRIPVEYQDIIKSYFR